MFLNIIEQKQKKRSRNRKYLNQTKKRNSEIKAKHKLNLLELRAKSYINDTLNRLQFSNNQ